MKNLIILIRLAIGVALGFGAAHFGVTPLGVFLGVLAVLHTLVTLRIALYVR